MDNTVVILLIVLLIVFGVFLITSSGSGGTGRATANYQSGGYGNQFAGGGCGR